MNPKTYTTPSGAKVSEEGQIVSGPAAFSTSNLAPATPLSLPSAPTLTSPQQMQAVTGSNAESLKAITDALQAPTPGQGAQNDTRQQILDTLTRISGKEGAQITAENAAGIPEQQKQLLDVTNQLQALNKEALAIPLQLQQDVTGRGVTKGGLEPIQTGQLRENAIKSLTLSASAQALQGNIALAQSQVDRAIALQFEPEEQKLDYLRQVYQFNQEDLSRADKRKADALNLLINERERTLQQQKQDRQAILNAQLEAARNGADSVTLQEIGAAESPEEATALAGSYLGAEYKQKAEQQKFQNGIQLRNLAINEAQQKLAQDKFAFEKSAKQVDINSGILPEETLKAIDNSPQGKKIVSLGDLKMKFRAYQGLIDQYGTSSVGSQKAKLDSAYSALKIAYKTAADLGAIQAPDVPLIEGALRSATYANPLTQAFAKITGNTVSTIKSGLQETESAIDRSGEQVLTELLSRDPRYSNSDYVKALALPFMKETPKQVMIGGQSYLIGSTVQNSKGQKGIVNADGSITPIQ